MHVFSSSNWFHSPEDGLFSEWKLSEKKKVCFLKWCFGVVIKVTKSTVRFLSNENGCLKTNFDFLADQYADSKLLKFCVVIKVTDSTVKFKWKWCLIKKKSAFWSGVLCCHWSNYLISQSNENGACWLFWSFRQTNMQIQNYYVLCCH